MHISDGDFRAHGGSKLGGEFVGENGWVWPDSNSYDDDGVDDGAGGGADLGVRLSER